MYKSLEEESKLTLFEDYKFSPIYAGALGRVMMELVEKGVSGIFNVGSKESCSKYEFGIKMTHIFLPCLETNTTK